jgi:hypothetical protein
LRLTHAAGINPFSPSPWYQAPSQHMYIPCRSPWSSTR